MIGNIGKYLAVSTFFLAGCTATVPAGFEFGDDSGRWPNDQECDDRRFFGPGMAVNLFSDQNGRDASDCRALLNQGLVQVWDFNAARVATQCSAIQWGDNSSPYVGNGVCDDPRFEGPGMHEIVLFSDSGRDASECRQLCEQGVIALRDY